MPRRAILKPGYFIWMARSTIAEVTRITNKNRWLEFTKDYTFIQQIQQIIILTANIWVDQVRAVSDDIRRCFAALKVGRFFIEIRLFRSSDPAANEQFPKTMINYGFLKYKGLAHFPRK